MGSGRLGLAAAGISAPTSAGYCAMTLCRKKRCCSDGSAGHRQPHLPEHRSLLRVSVLALSFFLEMKRLPLDPACELVQFGRNGISQCRMVQKPLLVIRSNVTCCLVPLSPSSCVAPCPVSSIPSAGCWRWGQHHSAKDAGGRWLRVKLPLPLG